MEKITITNAAGDSIQITHEELLDCLKKQDIDPRNVLIQYVRKFAAMVKDMRQAQANYFQSRNHSDLKQAKGLEKAVDDLIPKTFALTSKL